MTTHPVTPANLHQTETAPDDVGAGAAQEQPRPVKRQRCHQCKALVMPAALNELLRCLSCAGQLDLFPLTSTDASIVDGGRP